MIYTMRPAGHRLAEGLLEFVATLPDCCLMAEVGCYRGEATRIFLNKAQHVIAIDPWKDYIETNPLGGQTPMAHMADAEAIFDAFIEEHPDRITKYKGRSIEIAALIPDASLDLVYIDANHEYEDVCADLQAWRPKVKPGGLLAGHEYSMTWHAVVRAVQETLGEPDAVFPDTTWVKRVPPGPKAIGPAPRLGQSKEASPQVLIGVPTQERGGYRPFEMCLHQLMKGRPSTEVFYAQGTLVGARNRMVRQALAIGAEYLWMLDDDQPFFAGDPQQPGKLNDLDRLLARGVDAVVPLSCQRKSPFCPLLYSTIHPTESIAIQRYLLPDDHGLIPVAAAGMAGLLMKTSLFLKMGLDGWFEFQHPSNNFDDTSEDFQFYRKLERIGVQLYCDLDVSFGHAITSIAWVVQKQGQWLTVFSDSEPYMMALQPQHPLGLEHSKRQRDKLVPA